MRGAVGRVGLLVGSLAVLPLIIEVVLQIGALAVRLTVEEAPGRWTFDRLRILCLGDSITYGFWLADRADAYPSQLERIWNESGTSQKVEVINLGYPGTSSSRLLLHLPRMLESTEPDVIIVMIGANDFWTLPVEAGSEESGWGLRRFLRQHSRAYRLFYMIQRSLEPREVEILHDPNPLPELGGVESKVRYGRREFSMGWRMEMQPKQQAAMALNRNLESVVQYSREFGASLFLMTYPSGNPIFFYSAASPIIRTVAEETNTPLIDLAAKFGGLCADFDCLRFLLRDQHPNPEGHRVIAETVAQRLNQLYK